LELTLGILLKALFLALNSKTQENAITLKRFNTLFKATDKHKAYWLSDESELGKSLESHWQKLLKNISQTEHNLEICTDESGNTDNTNPSVTIQRKFYIEKSSDKIW
jgi:hypothetical protein